MTDIILKTNRMRAHIEAAWKLVMQDGMRGTRRVSPAAAGRRHPAWSDTCQRPSWPCGIVISSVCSVAGRRFSFHALVGAAPGATGG